MSIPIAPTPHIIEVNGMVFRWHIAEDRLHVDVSAPTQGWVAVGFNPKRGLAGTHLIMGAVVDGQTTVDDRYIVRIGQHRSISALGGVPSLSHIQGTETADETRLSFSLPLHAPDRFHQTLVPGETYHLLLAYSVDDDFMHHSRMRTHVSFQL